MQNKLLLSLIISSLSIYQAYAVTETKVYQYGYDSNGNTIAVERVTINTSQALYKYSYNNLNQMVGFEDTQNQKTFGYAYYPDGRRLSKQGYRESDQEEVVFYYGHQGQLMNESYSKNNQIQKQSSYFAGLRFVDDLVNHNDSHIQYPIADQHNHPATLSFAQGGSSIESYQLTDYGQLAQSNIKQTEISTQTNQLGLFNFELNPKVYGSGYYDSESNLQYMGARYYSADTQRFMAQDSYNLLNRYNYANGNPVMNYDPDGHKSVMSQVWAGIHSSASVYSLNGFGLGASLVSMPFTGGASLAIAGVITGILAGSAGIGAQLYSDYGSSGKLSKKLNYVAAAMGMIDIGLNASNITYLINSSKTLSSISEPVPMGIKVVFDEGAADYLTLYEKQSISKWLSYDDSLDATIIINSQIAKEFFPRELYGFDSLEVLDHELIVYRADQRSIDGLSSEYTSHSGEKKIFKGFMSSTYSDGFFKPKTFLYHFGYNTGGISTATTQSEAEKYLRAGGHMFEIKLKPGQALRVKPTHTGDWNGFNKEFPMAMYDEEYWVVPVAIEKSQITQIY